MAAGVLGILMLAVRPNGRETRMSEATLRVGAQSPLRQFLHRITFVDVALWGLRVLVLVVVIGGTIGTLISSRYGATQWFDFVVFGLTIGSIYAQVALGYTMVYGVLRLINFAHGDIMMTGAFAGYFVANGFDRSGFLAANPVAGHPDHDAGFGRRLDQHRRAGRAHRLPAVPPCARLRAADQRDRRLVLPGADVPRPVRLVA